MLLLHLLPDGDMLDMLDMLEMLDMLDMHVWAAVNSAHNSSFLHPV